MGTEGTIKRLGYLTEMGSVRLNDVDMSSWIQLMPLGSYQHELFGEINITPDKIKKFVDNFVNNVRGIQLDVDYDHKADNGKAAGWIQDIQDRGLDGLWGLVKWTQPAYEALKAGEYRYFSPEFQDEWEHPKTGVVHEDVLNGGAITNRPFLKDIQPINLSEVIRASEGGPVVDPKKLRQMLGLPEDATDEDVEKRAAELAATLTDPDEDPGDGTDGDDTGDNDGTSEEEDADEEPVLVQASELKAVKDELATMKKQLSEQAAARRLSEVKLGFKALSEGKKFTLPPAVLNKAQQLTVKLNDDQGNAFMGLLKEILDSGLVELGERGSANPNPGTDPSRQLDTLVTKKLSETNFKGEYVDALEAVYAENPALYAAYRAQQIGGGV